MGHVGQSASDAPVRHQRSHAGVAAVPAVTDLHQTGRLRVTDQLVGSGLRTHRGDEGPVPVLRSHGRSLGLRVPDEPLGRREQREEALEVFLCDPQLLLTVQRSEGRHQRRRVRSTLGRTAAVADDLDGRLAQGATHHRTVEPGVLGHHGVQIRLGGSHQVGGLSNPSIPQEDRHELQATARSVRVRDEPRRSGTALEAPPLHPAPHLHDPLLGITADLLDGVDHGRRGTVLPLDPRQSRSPAGLRDLVLLRSTDQGPAELAVLVAEDTTGIAVPAVTPVIEPPVLEGGTLQATGVVQHPLNVRPLGLTQDRQDGLDDRDHRVLQRDADLVESVQRVRDGHARHRIRVALHVGRAAGYRRPSVGQRVELRHGVRPLRSQVARHAVDLLPVVNLRDHPPEALLLEGGGQVVAHQQALVSVVAGLRDLVDHVGHPGDDRAPGSVVVGEPPAHPHDRGRERLDLQGAGDVLRDEAAPERSHHAAHVDGGQHGSSLSLRDNRDSHTNKHNTPCVMPSVDESPSRSGNLEGRSSAPVQGHGRHVLHGVPDLGRLPDDRIPVGDRVAALHAPLLVAPALAPEDRIPSGLVGVEEAPDLGHAEASVDAPVRIGVALRLAVDGLVDGRHY